MMEHSNDTVRRLFIAIMLPSAIQQQLAGLAGLLDEYRAILRPVRAEALHFTLRFLGNVAPAQEALIAQACADAVEGIAVFPLAVGGFGAFPNERRPRVVWLDLREGAEPLVALQQRLQDELLRRRIVRDREEFTPHLTLARVRPEAAPAARAALGAALRTLPQGEQARCTATALSLVHSVLTPHGSRYTLVNDWHLMGKMDTSR